MRFFFCLCCFFVFGPAYTQVLVVKGRAHSEVLEQAWQLAIATIDSNTTPQKILKAGAQYGGEWTRDASINSWNGVSLLRPEVAAQSLWSVTKNKDTVGHQYWDKIIWVVAALNHYNSTGDKIFLQQAYRCAHNTMAELEQTAFRKDYGLFTGPAHINDGIAGYPQPPFDPNNKSSFVLDHAGTRGMMSLVGNTIYFGAYTALAQMARLLQKTEIAAVYEKKKSRLQQNIHKHFYRPEENMFWALLLQDGSKHQFQDAFATAYGLSFGLWEAIMGKKHVLKAIGSVTTTPFGIPLITPHFPRYSDTMPGRHNLLIWPPANGFWATAALEYGIREPLFFEWQNLAHLAIDSNKGNRNFEEIYNPNTGKEDGGWQSGFHWKSKDHQSWSATAYLRMVLYGVLGIRLDHESISIEPALPAYVDSIELSGLSYGGCNIHLSVNRTRQQGIWVNGKKMRTAAFSRAWLSRNKKLSIRIGTL